MIASLGHHDEQDDDDWRRETAKRTESGPPSGRAPSLDRLPARSPTCARRDCTALASTWAGARLVAASRSCRPTQIE